MKRKRYTGKAICRMCCGDRLNAQLKAVIHRRL